MAKGSFGKKKADFSGVQRLQKDLKEQNYGRLYVFYGEEIFLRDKFLRNLREALLPAGTETFNFHEFHGKEMTIESLEEAVDCLPMMAAKTFVLIHDWDIFKLGESSREQLVSILSQIPDYCTLVFFFDQVAYKGDARTKLATSMAEIGVFVDFPCQEQGDLENWVIETFRGLEKNCSHAVAADLIFYCGDFMTKLSSEIEKIAAYSPEQEVKSADIYAVATPHLEAVAFEISNALAEKNFDKALGILSELYQMQEPPLKILGGITRQIRLLYSGKLALNNGKGEQYLAQLWGMKGYPAKLALGASRHFSLEWCQRASLLCAKTDRAMKQSGKDPEELLTQLMLELAQGG